MCAWQRGTADKEEIFFCWLAIFQSSNWVLYLSSFPCLTGDERRMIRVKAQDCFCARMLVLMMRFLIFDISLSLFFFLLTFFFSFAGGCKTHFLFEAVNASNGPAAVCERKMIWVDRNAGSCLSCECDHCWLLVQNGNNDCSRLIPSSCIRLRDCIGVPGLTSVSAMSSARVIIPSHPMMNQPTILRRP